MKLLNCTCGLLILDNTVPECHRLTTASILIQKCLISLESSFSATKQVVLVVKFQTICNPYEIIISNQS